jgi:hypothetical protein
MKGKDVEEKVKFTTLQNGDVTRKTPFSLFAAEEPQSFLDKHKSVLSGK